MWCWTSSSLSSGGCSSRPALRFAPSQKKPPGGAATSKRHGISGRPFERALLDAVLEALDELLGSQGEQVLVHQDLHPGDVLRAEREPWLVIDPKPLVGEREFAVAPIVRALELGHDRRLVLERLDRLTRELDLDRERARQWCVVQTIAWSFGSDYFERHVETARWLA
jgi:streptomycin 6-kinase